MRIISGNNKGTKLKTLEGENTRPTLDRVKEALFSIIYSRKSDIDNVLDLFSGSGSLGLEMLSRGAQKAYFCDSSKQAVNIITENIERCRQQDNCIVINRDYIECLKLLEKEKIKFDLIFLDPPYDKGMGIKSIEYIYDFNLLSENGLIVLETSEKESIPEVLYEFEIVDERKYGRIKIYIFMRKE